MRGHGKALPRYRKHKVSGQAIVTLDGRDFYLGPYGTKASHAEYDRLVGEWQMNGRRLPTPEPRSITVTQLCAEYLRFAKTYYVKNGRPTDEQPGIKAAIRQICATYGRIPVTEFGPLSLEAVRQQMIRDGNCRKYINKQTGRLKRMFKWGVSRQLVPVQVHQALATVDGLRHGKSAARETDPVMPVSDTHVEQTITHLHPTLAAMVTFQRMTGCRPGEVCSMKCGEIDRTGPVWQYRPGSHKMEHKGRPRVVLIGPRAQQVLLPYLLKSADSECFQNGAGQPYDSRDYYKRIQAACDRAFPAPDEIKGPQRVVWRKRHRWSPNQLRHTAATEIRRQFGLEASQVVLGHSSADVTQIYAERDIATAAKIMAAVG